MIPSFEIWQLPPASGVWSSAHKLNHTHIHMHIYMHIHFSRQTHRTNIFTVNRPNTMNTVSPTNEMFAYAESCNSPSAKLMIKKRRTEKSIENSTTSLFLPAPVSGTAQSSPRQRSTNHRDRIPSPTISPPPPPLSSSSSSPSSPLSSSLSSLSSSPPAPPPRRVTSLSPPSHHKQKKTVRWKDDLCRWASEDSKNQSMKDKGLTLCLPTKPTRSNDSTPVPPPRRPQSSPSSFESRINTLTNW